MAVAQKPVMAGNLAWARGTKMRRDQGFSERIDRIVKLAWTMIEDYHMDEAAVLLFDLHKLHPGEWMEVRRRLFDLCHSPSRLSQVSTLIKCSASFSLSGWEPLIPGLYQFSANHEPTELFD
jgi:hypothetical protein